jgi:26S proteasome regulatory subunit T3
VAEPASEDLFVKLKGLQRQLEFFNITDGYIKDEMKNLKRELIRAKAEVKRIQSVPLVIGQFNELIDQDYGIISSTSGTTYYVRILSTLDREELKPNSSIALHRHSHAVVDILPAEADSSIQMMQMTEKPDVTYKDIGGMDIQKQEVREAVELPLTHFELYKQIGIDPPRGVRFVHSVVRGRRGGRGRGKGEKALLYARRPFPWGLWRALYEARRVWVVF